MTNTYSDLQESRNKIFEEIKKVSTSYKEKRKELKQNLDAAIKKLDEKHAQTRKDLESKLKTLNRSLTLHLIEIVDESEELSGEEFKPLREMMKVHANNLIEINCGIREYFEIINERSRGGIFEAKLPLLVLYSLMHRLILRQHTSLREKTKTTLRSYLSFFNSNKEDIDQTHKWVLGEIQIHQRDLLLRFIDSYSYRGEDDINIPPQLEDFYYWEGEVVYSQKYHSRRGAHGLADHSLGGFGGLNLAQLKKNNKPTRYRNNPIKRLLAEPPTDDYEGSKTRFERIEETAKKSLSEIDDITESNFKLKPHVIALSETPRYEYDKEFFLAYFPK